MLDDASILSWPWPIRDLAVDVLEDSDHSPIRVDDGEIVQRQPTGQAFCVSRRGVRGHRRQWPMCDVPHLKRCLQLRQGLFIAFGHPREGYVRTSPHAGAARPELFRSA